MTNKVIGQFIDTQVVGGAEVLVVELSRLLETHELVPIIIHFGNKWITEACWRFNLQQVQIPYHKLYKSFKTLPVFAWHFRQFLIKYRVDVLHSHLFDPICAGTLATTLCPIKHIGTLHDTHTLTERPVKLFPLKASAITGTRLITVSYEMASYLICRARIPQQRLQVIYNGIELAKRQQFDKQVRRRNFGLTPEEITVVCVGRLVPVKAHEILFEAWAMLERAIKARLLIIGDGPRRPELEQMVRDHGLSDRIRFLGLRHDVADLLNLADIFVLSSHSEGLSCSILEAMAAGLPVVATAVGGNPELVMNGVNGYLVPPADSLSLSARLSELIANSDRRQAFGVASRQLAEQKFSIHHMVEQYVRLYREVLASRRHYN
jgi:glycosyltransferase involved in cell wall biosynthesis